MPAPIEISRSPLWLKAKKEKQEVTAQSALFDFNVGYIGTALLALVFVALGALVLHGTGVELSRPKLASPTKGWHLRFLQLVNGLVH